MLNYWRRKRPKLGFFTRFILFAVRLFSRVHIHALNSHKERVSVFRQAVIQFSVGGKLYDKYGAPIIHEHQRDAANPKPRWVSIGLDKRIGQYVTITLLFDFDWIVLSEITFDSSNDDFKHFVAI